MNRRWIRPLLLGIVVILLLGTLLLAPAQAGRAIKSTYHALPTPVRKLVPDTLERNLGRGIDSVTQFFSLGDPHSLIKFDLRLKSSSIPPGGWGGQPLVRLEWDPLESSTVTYEVRVGPNSTTSSPDPIVARTAQTNLTLPLPGDGDWFVYVRPFAGSAGGHTTRFGPFRIDSSPPPVPVLDPIPTPRGYNVRLTWSSVSDVSGIAQYQIERIAAGTLFQSVATSTTTHFSDEQLGNGQYTYRIRAQNGAGILGPPSNVQEILVQAPMQNPGPGVHRYGIQANYTSFLHLWDLSNPDRYARLHEVPDDIAKQYLGEGYGIETKNQTLIQKTHEIVASERNTLLLAERIFVWLFDWADYDTDKLNNATAEENVNRLQRAGETYDRRKGICGDLATLYITMLRIAGVPARPVHGYLDNPSAGIGDFHVWVEVWVGASLRSNDPSDTRDDWMTVDVSGISGPYDEEDLMISFGIFNPEYLALGIEANYADESWNSWAEFAWSRPPGPDPEFSALGTRVELDSESKNLFFNTATKQRVLVDGTKPPDRSFSKFYPDVKVVSTKRLDYGVDISGPIPTEATIRLRYPITDEFSAVLPWQSVIYTIYTDDSAARTVDRNPLTGKLYSIDSDGFVRWEDDFK